MKNSLILTTVDIEDLDKLDIDTSLKYNASNSGPIIRFENINIITEDEPEYISKKENICSKRLISIGHCIKQWNSIAFGYVFFVYD